MKRFLPQKVHCIFFALSSYILPFTLHAQILPQSGHNGNFVYEIHPDNKLLVSGGDDGKLIFYNLENAKAFRETKPHGKKISWIDFSPDGLSFLSASHDSIILVHDIGNKKEMRRLNAGMQVNVARFNPKASFIGAAGTNGKIKLLDENSGKELFRIELSNSVTGLCFSSNGAILFSSSGKDLFIHEMKAGSQLGKMSFVSLITGIRLSQNDKFLLIDLAEGSTEVFELGALASKGNIKNQLTQKGYFSPEISSDGRFVFTTDTQNHLIVYEVETKTGVTYNTAPGRGHYSKIRQNLSGSFLVAQDEKNGLDIIYFSSEVFEKEKGIYWKRLQFSPERIRETEFSSDGGVLALKGTGLYNFNLATGDLFRRDEDSLKMDNASYYVRYVAPEKTEGSPYYAIDFVKGKAWKFVNNQSLPLEQVAWNTDTSIISFCSPDNHLIYDSKSRKILLNEKFSGTRRLFRGQTSLQTVAFQENDGQLILFDVKSAKKNSVSVSIKGPLELAGQTANGICFYAPGGACTMVDVQTGKEKNAGVLSGIKFKKLSCNGNFAAGLTTDFHLLSFDLGNGKKTGDLVVPSKNYVHISVSPSGKEIALTDDENRAELYGAVGEKLCTVFCTPDDGIIAWTESNYYVATKQAARNIAFVADDNATPFGVYDFRYNRPDIVLEKLKKADAKYIAALKKAVMKRTEALVQSSEGNVPVIKFASTSQFPVSTSSEKLKADISIVSGLAELKQLELKINGVLINTIALSPSTIQQLEVPLVNGSNNVEIFAATKNGIRSEPLSFKTVCTAENPKTLFVVSIGVSRYKDSSFNLHYADKDAKDISELLKNDKEFSMVKNLSLKNSEVTRAGLEKIKSFIAEAKINDVVIVYVAGHGVLDKDLNYYFAAYDLDFANPAQKGISFSELEKILASATCVRKVLFMDTCHSGELEKDEVEKSNEKNTSSEAIVFRNAGPGIKKKTVFGAGNASQLTRELFSGLKNSTGAIVISSSGGAEFAMESDAWKNGLFTYCVLHGLKDKAADKDKDGKIKISELQEYVAKEVQRMSGGRQIPTSRMENFLVDFVLF